MAFFISTSVIGQDVSFQLGNECGASGDTVKICVTVGNFIDFVSIQGTVDYSEAQATFIGLTDFGLPGMLQGNFNTSNPGVVAYSWFDATLNGVTLPNDEIIFCIDFEVQNGGTGGPIRFTNNPTAFEVVDISFSQQPFDTIPGSISNGSSFTDVISSCQPIAWIDGITYSANNNTAMHTIAAGNVHGCDSVVSLDLTINPIDVGTTNTANEITATNALATYQWLDCGNAFATIPNEQLQTFIAGNNGSFAVEIKEGGCTDTSACVNLLTVGFNSTMGLTKFLLYPNPSSSIVHIISQSKVIEVTDLVGHVVISTGSNNGHVELNVSELSSGTYLVRTDNGISQMLFVSQ
jgi:hypothetical protein